MNAKRPARQQGQILIMAALCLVVLIGSVGLAIDSGLGYMVKAKLNAAVDSAAIAAARAVTQGADEAAQTASAQQAAREFFAANYPAGYLGTTPSFNDPTITFNKGQVTVNAAATAVVPVSFMRVLNFNLLNVAAAGQTIRRDLDMAFVVDTSGSMIPSQVQVRDNSELFLTKFNQTLDRMALIHFSFGAVVDDAIRPVARGFDRTSMNTHINNFNFDGFTNSAEGFWRARDQLNSIAVGDRSSLRVIVFFSDGAPNTFSSQFKFAGLDTACRNAATNRRIPGSLISNDTLDGAVNGLWQIDQQVTRLPADCNTSTNANPSLISPGISRLASDALPAYYNAHPNPANVNLDEFLVVGGGPRAVTTSEPSYINVNRASRNLVEAMAAKARSEGIYVFTLGLGFRLTEPTGPDKEPGDVVLKCMANTADAQPGCVAAGAGQPVGIYCHAVDANALKPCFEKLASAILRITR
jgi:Flp pilus assembly protein TadG